MSATDEKLISSHAESVKRIQESVKKFRDEGRHFRIYHGSTSSTRPLNFTRDNIVDVSDMNRLFPVDQATKTVKAEPNVPMDALVAHTLKAGLVPKIVMEFKGITVGGGYSGMSGESNMHKHGLFQNTVSEIEIVLGDGSLEHASRTVNEDLLEHAGGSLGTFGIVTLLTVELFDAKKFVNLEITKIDGPENVVPTFEAAVASTPQPEYIDGIFYNKAKIVMMTGHISDDAAHPPLKKMQVHWFSAEVEKRYANLPSTLTMHLEDYLFRFDHGAFWGGNLAFDHFHIPNIAPFRRLADPFLDSRTCYHALHKTGLADEYVVQDFGVPASNVAAFISYVQDVMPKCQLFLVPALSADGMKISSRMNPLVQAVRTERVYGVGVYGRGPRDAEAFKELNRKLETKASELLAAKLLYARTYYTHDEFWEIYNKPAYDEVRRKYKAVVVAPPPSDEAEKNNDAEADGSKRVIGLPDVYEKLAADMKARPKRQSIRGVVATVFDKVTGRKEYLLPKK
ncbi:FAD-binding domain-containing protein [Pseudovirgaria hyperparasitica]|uniref:Delta(24)-sterol reductase n=1 Tax=Pseudovirgaria hyperparasitica TaxID=470096 RepID=A0A6A6VZC1_9PEZI|nr:FAD-binding domain-containing protein [Pseudovirgaria hyperparasitica]KAF2756002.1 FAD-binding domain-containing protein [Pseudovirgaria hyperparasitica]